MDKDNFKIASISKEDEQAIKRAENEVKNATGKDFVMIAWEKK